MVLSYYYCVKDINRDLRGTLAQNIKTARESLNMTKSRLAEYAGTSVSSIVDIERCRTWVSDRTLSNIAQALNMEAYELLMLAPDNDKTATQTANHDSQTVLLQQITELIANKKLEIRKSSDSALNNLAHEIILKIRH
jgi:transcriptional regulator with XRE-family HTH domain